MSVSARQRQKLFFSRGVYVNGSSAHTKRLLKAGDMVAIRQFKDTGYGVVPEEGAVEVLYEDNEVIVLNKPAGMLVHPAGQTGSGTLANYLAHYFKVKGQMVTITAWTGILPAACCSPKALRCRQSWKLPWQQAVCTASMRQLSLVMWLCCRQNSRRVPSICL